MSVSDFITLAWSLQPQDILDDFTEIQYSHSLCSDGKVLAPHREVDSYRPRLGMGTCPIVTADRVDCHLGHLEMLVFNSGDEKSPLLVDV